MKQMGMLVLKVVKKIGTPNKVVPNVKKNYLDVSDNFRAFDDDRHAFFRCVDFFPLELGISQKILFRNIDVQHLNLVVERLDISFLSFNTLLQVRYVFHPETKVGSFFFSEFLAKLSHLQFTQDSLLSVDRVFDMSIQ